jgi:hypothetical protein
MSKHPAYRYVEIDDADMERTAGQVTHHTIVVVPANSAAL